MTPGQILNGIQSKNILLQGKTEEYKRLLDKRAEAERQHSVALAKEYLKLRADGTPATLIPKVASGNVADLKYQMDIAEGLVKACKESLTDIRTAIDSFRSALAWEKVEYQNAR